MEYSLCSPLSLPLSWLSSQDAIYSSDFNVICDYWSRAGAWLMRLHSLLSVDGQCSLHSKGLPVWLCFLESPSDIHGAVSRHLLWDLTLESVFHRSTWKYWIYFFYSVLLRLFVSDRSGAFLCSTYCNVSSKKAKNNPNQPNKTTVPVHTRILVLVRLLVIHCGEWGIPTEENFKCLLVPHYL